MPNKQSCPREAKLRAAFDNAFKALYNAIHQEIGEKPPVSEAENEKLYYELLWAVESRFPGESRHETALRYIRERESRCETGSEKPN